MSKTLLAMHQMKPVLCSVPSFDFTVDDFSEITESIKSNVRECPQKLGDLGKFLSAEHPAPAKNLKEFGSFLSVDYPILTPPFSPTSIFSFSSPSSSSSSSISETPSSPKTTFSFVESGFLKTQSNQFVTQSSPLICSSTTTTSSYGRSLSSSRSSISSSRSSSTSSEPPSYPTSCPTPRKQYNPELPIPFMETSRKVCSEQTSSETLHKPKTSIKSSIGKSITKLEQLAQELEILDDDVAQILEKERKILSTKKDKIDEHQANKLLILNKKAGSNILQAHRAFKDVQETVTKMNDMMASVEMEVEEKAKKLNVESLTVFPKLRSSAVQRIRNCSQDSNNSSDNSDEDNEAEKEEDDMDLNMYIHSMQLINAVNKDLQQLGFSCNVTLEKLK